MLYFRSVPQLHVHMHVDFGCAKCMLLADYRSSANMVAQLAAGVQGGQGDGAFSDLHR